MAVREGSSPWNHDWCLYSLTCVVLNELHGTQRATRHNKAQAVVPAAQMRTRIGDPSIEITATMQRRCLLRDTVLGAELQPLDHGVGLAEAMPHDQWLGPQVTRRAVTQPILASMYNQPQDLRSTLCLEAGRHRHPPWQPQEYTRLPRCHLHPPRLSSSNGAAY